MKRIIALVPVAAALVFAGYSLGQTGATPQQKLVKMVSLNDAAAVHAFESNVALLHAEGQEAVDLNAAVQKEKDAKKKKELSAKLDAKLKQLNEDNAKMIKMYGFSLTRNYTMEITSAEVYLQVSDEEAAKIEQQEAAKKKK
jgi:hypothetical protein